MTTIRFSHQVWDQHLSRQVDWPEAPAVGDMVVMAADDWPAAPVRYRTWTPDGTAYVTLESDLLDPEHRQTPVEETVAHLHASGWTTP